MEKEEARGANKIPDLIHFNTDTILLSIFIP